MDKFKIEYDEVPALIFVQHKNGKIDLAADGWRINGFRSVQINASMNEETTYIVNYVNSATKYPLRKIGDEKIESK